MKKLFLPLLLLVNLVTAQDQITLDSPVVHLGYLESVNGLPFNNTITLLRNEDSPNLVEVIFSYTQTEMICADRMPDGGGGYCNGGCCNNECEERPCHDGGCKEKSNEKYWDWQYDRNFMGICRKWTTMETQKSGKVKLVFKKDVHNDEGDTIKLNIYQRDLHSTVFWVKGWVVDPKDYYRVLNLDRSVIFR